MLRFRPRSSKRHFSLGGKPRRLVLSPDWQAWLAENRLGGIPKDRLVAALVAKGVPRHEVERRLHEIETSPAFVGATRLARRARQLTLVAKLQTEIERRATRPTEIERRTSPSADDLMDRYYATGTPVVLVDAMHGWPALHRWTPAYFRERFGDVEVGIVDAREADPDYDMNFRTHVTTVTMRDYVDRVLAAGDTNDFYMIANNRNLERPELRVLWEDVRLPSYLDPGAALGSSALWLGPPGTVTPLHHDTSSILFCQIYGRKRIRLVSPMEQLLLDGVRGVYSSVDPESPALERDPELRELTIKSVDLAPGEALLIPVGWWHHVRALDVSISLALNNFRVPNAYEWYNPGG